MVRKEVDRSKWAIWILEEKKIIKIAYAKCFVFVFRFIMVRFFLRSSPKSCKNFYLMETLPVPPSTQKIPKCMNCIQLTNIIIMKWMFSRRNINIYIEKSGYDNNRELITFSMEFFFVAFLLLRKIWVVFFLHHTFIKHAGIYLFPQNYWNQLICDRNVVLEMLE